jgi:ZIP family zinc transporter
MGAGGRNDVEASHSSSLVVPLALAIILGGLPESVAIGLGILEGGAVSVAMLVAVFISNLPEAIAATAGLRSGRWSGAKVLLLWLAIAVVCAGASAAGYGLLGDLSPRWLSFVQTFAGRAILMMLANTMMPEAYEHGGKLAGVFTVLGFAVCAWVIVLEHAGSG